MRHPALLLACVYVAAACGSEPLAVAELGEVCGEPGPFRVLALEPGEQIFRGRQLTVGDRELYVVTRHDEDAADARYPTITDTTVWATGPCGEAPARVASGVDFLVAPAVWPDVVLGCRTDGNDVVVLDPSGASEPRVLFPGVGGTQGWGCGFAWSPHGVVALAEHDADRGALVLHRYPADPDDEADATVLLDPIRITMTSGAYGPGRRGLVLQSFDEFVLALTPDDELVRVELADGAVTTLQAGVALFDASGDGRYVLWQSASNTGDDPDRPTGKVFLRDQSDGSEVLLAETSLADGQSSMRSAVQGVFILALPSPSQGIAQRVYFLPALDFVDVPTGLFLSAPLGDDLWLAQRIFEHRWVSIDLRSGVETLLFSGRGRLLTRDEEALVFVGADSDRRDEGPVWRIPLDGADSTRLAGRATWDAQILGDGRLLTPLSVDRRWLGPLVLVDPATDEEAMIDDQVFSQSLDPSPADDEGVVRYSVDDGERSGVYLARLPP